MLVVNDEFGALAVALFGCQVTSWSDSIVSRTATLDNLRLNDLSTEGVTLVRGDEQPVGTFDTVIVRIPKTTALLDYQLQVLATLVTPTTRCVGVGMARHIHRSTLALFEASIGTTTSSRATRKARLIHAEPDGAVLASSSLQPPTADYVTPADIRVAELPGTFSAGHVDAGTAVLIDVVTQSGPPRPGVRVADLGCGNGVIAASVAHAWGSGAYTLLDASDLAVAAARKTWELNELDPATCDIRVSDGFDGVADRTFDVIVTNPPFHQGHAVDRDMTDRLLADAARALTADGTMYVVAQRHLQLHTRLKRWFARVETQSKHPTHVVLVASKPKQR